MHGFPEHTACTDPGNIVGCVCVCGGGGGPGPFATSFFIGLMGGPISYPLPLSYKNPNNL